MYTKFMEFKKLTNKYMLSMEKMGRWIIKDRN